MCREARESQLLLGRARARRPSAVETAAHGRGQVEFERVAAELLADVAARYSRVEIVQPPEPLRVAPCVEQRETRQHVVVAEELADRELAVADGRVDVGVVHDDGRRRDAEDLLAAVLVAERELDLRAARPSARGARRANRRARRNKRGGRAGLACVRTSRVYTRSASGSLRTQLTVTGRL